MDLNQLKKLMDKEKAKVIIVENGEPILIVSPFEEEQQQLSLHPSPSLEGRRVGSSPGRRGRRSERIDPSPLAKGERVDKRPKRAEDIAAKPEKIIQSTELLTKEEMPADELTIEDLPF